jgi:sugar phosphate isomerase/epimerase
MFKSQITRRDAIKASAALMLPVSGACSTLAMANAPSNKSPIIGMSTLGFGEYSNQQLAGKLAEVGVSVVQLFLNQTDSRYWKYNGRSDVSEVTVQRCKEIAGVYRSAGISIHSIGVYTNLIHPEDSELKANLEYFDAMMEIGANMGVRKFVTEAGHYHSDKLPASPVPYHFQEDLWHRTVKTGKELAKLARRHKATILLEPFYRGFFASAKRTRIFLEEVDSPHIKALLDPANLLEINDIEEMFAQLGPWIECLHAKDRKLHVDRGVPAGQGDLDYKQFIAAAAKYTPDAPFILEYVGSNDYQQALTMLRSLMPQG